MLKIRELQDLAKKRGGRCLSTSYLGPKIKLQWECLLRHRWLSGAYSIKQGQWCPVCASKRRGASQRHSIEDMRVRAEKYGGKCLSTGYNNARTKLKWQCEKGHVWWAVPAQIKAGHWCHKCRGGVAKYTIRTMQEWAHERGGKCLSNNYSNFVTKLTWECAEGHVWEARPGSIKRGTWCPKCGRIKAFTSHRHTIDEIQAIASSRGGRCLSKKYDGPKKKLLWQCAEGHRWKAYLQTVKSSGTWCPECSSGIGERICREFFEQLFLKKFSKAYPKWLKNLEGSQLQLDGYSKELGIAFEHQGIHHYRPAFYAKSKKAFEQFQKNDRIKRQLCREHNVKLLEIPQIPTHLELAQIKPFIKTVCMQKGIGLPKGYGDIEVKLNKAYAPNPADSVNELRGIARAKGGECLSPSYLGWSIKLYWRCQKGHVWEASPNNIKRGKWCPECAKTTMGVYHKLSIEEMQKTAKKRGGLCLSTEYVNASEKLKWQCKEGHIWEATAFHIRQGTWCPICAIKDYGSYHKLDIGEMRETAKAKGGYCLSTTYANNSTPLKWKCKHGHTWEARPSNIRFGQWCPYCSRRRRSGARAN